MTSAWRPPTMLSVLGFVLALLVSLTQAQDAAASVLEAWLAPNARLWPRWQTHDATSEIRPDHTPWDQWLAANVSTDAQGLARIAYGKVSPADAKTLSAYIQYLSDIRVSDLNRDTQRAYWINLYNAATVDLILRYYPVTSIRDIKISPGFFSFGPWDKKLLTVEAESLSLNDIEHRILRPIWQDPRIHYALNCASVGCPNLQTVAFTAGNSDVLLNTAASTYINNRRGVEIIDGKLRLSSIYNWFTEDFGGDLAGVTAHLAAFAEPALAAILATKPRLAGYRYDWDLNDAARP